MVESDARFAILKLFLIWLFLVSFNALLSFYLALASHPNLIALILGVLTFVVAYSWLDCHLMSRGLSAIRSALYWGVIVKALLQTTIFVEVYAGLLALILSEMLIDNQSSFIFSYVAVVVQGILLSIVAGVLGSLIYWCQYYFRRKRPA